MDEQTGIRTDAEKERDDWIFKLLTTTSERQWNKLCDEIKKAYKSRPEECSGDYPAWWFEKVLRSGLLSLVQRQWRD